MSPDDVRIAHLGLGAFHRAHQAFYTECANRAAESQGARTWGIAAFTGRRPDVANQLQAQGGRYSLLIRGPVTDRIERVSSIRQAHDGADAGAWQRTLTDPAVEILSLTITEAGYLTDASGVLDVAQPLVDADLHLVQEGAYPTTAPARIAWGLAHRRAADAGPLTVVSCDNLADNGRVTQHVVRSFADLVDPSLSAWIDQSVCFVSSMVDRITPATNPADIADVLRLTGLRDDATVVTEPFSEWVLAGEFRGGRPQWEICGARFVDDVTPFEQRKLWLLNGAHSLLAYVGSARGHHDVASAIADPFCLALVNQWWDCSSPLIDLPTGELAHYRGELLVRFGNARIRHRLAQIAADGSQKIPLRFLAILARERAEGRLPEVIVTLLAAWIVHLRGDSGEITDDPLWPMSAAGPLPDAVPRVLALLAPELADDAELTASVLAACHVPALRA